MRHTPKMRRVPPDTAQPDVDAGGLKVIPELLRVLERIRDVALAVDDLDGAADAGERVARVGGAADEEVDGELVHAVEALGRPVFDGEGGSAFDEAGRGRYELAWSRRKYGRNARFTDGRDLAVEGELHCAGDGVTQDFVVDVLRIVEGFYPAVVNLPAALGNTFRLLTRQHEHDG